MIEGVVVDCLRAKWKAFIQARLPETIDYKPSSWKLSLLQSLFIQLPEAVRLLPSLPRPHCRCFWPSLHRDQSQETYIFTYIFAHFGLNSVPSCFLSIIDLNYWSFILQTTAALLFAFKPVQQLELLPDLLLVKHLLPSSWLPARGKYPFCTISTFNEISISIIPIMSILSSLQCSISTPRTTMRSFAGAATHLLLCQK